MEVVGYCTIKKTATSGAGTEIDSFLGQDVRVMEFARDGGALVVNNKATAMAMFDKQDIYRSFECSMCGEVICPPKMSLVEQTLYVGKVMLRKGGYNNILKNMVIQASLMKGKLYDDFLFQMEREENFSEES